MEILLLIVDGNGEYSKSIIGPRCRHETLSLKIWAVDISPPPHTSVGGEVCFLHFFFKNKFLCFSFRGVLGCLFLRERCWSSAIGLVRARMLLSEH
jgi:hypothetical protein